MVHSARHFLTLLANGANIEQMQKASKLAKSYFFGVSAMPTNVAKSQQFELTKEAAEAVKSIRIENGVAEQAVMTALGLSDVQEYVAWENGQATIELSPENFTALAKVLKTDVATLAAKMVSADGPNPVLDNAGEPGDGAAAGSGGGGDQTMPPGGTAPAKSNATATSAQIQKDKLAGTGARIFNIGAGNGVVVLDKSAEVQKAQLKKELLTAFSGIVGTRGIQKGTLVAEDFSPSNILNPSLANELINLVVDQSAFLKSVQVRPMEREVAEVLVWDIYGRQFARSAPGWPTAADLQKGINKSKKLTATKQTLYWLIENRTLNNYRSNVPGLENEIFSGFTQAFRNNMMDLAFNGATENWDSIIAAGGTPDFTDLNKGWFTLATANAPAGQVINATTDDTLYDNANHTTGNLVTQKVFDKMITLSKSTTNGNARFFDGSEPFVMSDVDWEAHEQLILSGQYAQASPLLANGIEPKYRRRAVTTSNFINSKNYLYTKLMNYILGIVTGDNGADGIVIERHIVPQGVLYCAVIYMDFEFVNNNAIVVAHS